MSLFISNRKCEYDKQLASAIQSKIDTGLDHLVILMSADKSFTLELFQDYLIVMVFFFLAEA